MGRETKLLLALLGLLAGVFVGVLSMKLLVPRPPAGAGPDIHDDIAAATPAEIVEPPALAAAAEPAAVVADDDRYASRSAFARTDAAPADDVTADSPPVGEPVAEPSADRFTDRVSLDEGAVETAAFAEPAPLAAGAARSARLLEAPPAAFVSAAGYAAPAAIAPGRYVTVDGDSWWSLAERTYGDGRLYRALFAWNRAKNPRVSAVPGTALDLPTRSQLATAWPQFMPRE